MKKNLLPLVIILSFAKLVSASGDFGVRAQSFGGAYRAVASSNDTIYFNPAGILKSRRISPDIDYFFNHKENTHRIGASVVDSSTTSWGMGLAYSAAFSKDKDKASSHLFHLTTAMPLGTDIFTMGSSFTYEYHASQENHPYRHFFNMDMSFMINAPFGLSFAVVADHMFKPKGNEKSMGLAFATAFNIEELVPIFPLVLSFDWLMDDFSGAGKLKQVIAAGAQYTVLGILPIRMGFSSRVNGDDNKISLGTGIKFASFAFDALYQQHLTIGRQRNFGAALRMSL